MSKTPRAYGVRLCLNTLRYTPSLTVLYLETLLYKPDHAVTTFGIPQHHHPSPPILLISQTLQDITGPFLLPIQDGLQLYASRRPSSVSGFQHSITPQILTGCTA